MTNKKIVRLTSILVLIALLVVAIPTQAFAAESNEFVHYNQRDYADVPYGKQPRNSSEIKSVKERGCGITCLAMVASYLYQDESITPDYLAIVYGNPDEPVEGVDYGSLANIMVSVGTNHLGLNMELVWTFDKAEQALKEGKVVITLQNEGCFTDVPNGHFVVFYGITEDGRILVDDPNGRPGDPLDKDNLPQGPAYRAYPQYFVNGFPQDKVRNTASGYWIVTVAESTNSNIS